MAKMLGMSFDDEESAWKVMQGVEASGRIASAQVINFWQSENHNHFLILLDVISYCIACNAGPQGSGNMQTDKRADS